MDIVTIVLGIIGIFMLPWMVYVVIDCYTFHYEMTQEIEQCGIRLSDDVYKKLQDIPQIANRVILYIVLDLIYLSVIGFLLI